MHTNTQTLMHIHTHQRDTHQRDTHMHVHINDEIIYTHTDEKLQFKLLDLDNFTYFFFRHFQSLAGINESRNIDRPLNSG